MVFIRLDLLAYDSPAVYSTLFCLLPDLLLSNESLVTPGLGVCLLEIISMLSG